MTPDGARARDNSLPAAPSFSQDRGTADRGISSEDIP
jgi:hypothetical protein